MSIVNNSRSIDFFKLQQMVFIYNAVMNGWQVQKIDNGSFEFQKQLACIEPANKNEIGTDVKDSFIYKFLRNHLSLGE